MLLGEYTLSLGSLIVVLFEEGSEFGGCHLSNVAHQGVVLPGVLLDVMGIGMSQLERGLRNQQEILLVVVRQVADRHGLNR